MIALFILGAFLAGWFGGIRAYKYGLKNSPVMLPPKNKYDGFRDIERKIETNYNIRMAEYNRHVTELEKQRKDFYEKNPDFPIKTLFMNVIAPPQKVIIKNV